MKPEMEQEIDWEQELGYLRLDRERHRKRKVDFWTGLEGMSSGVALMVDWEFRFGSAVDVLRPFLEVTGERTETFPCPAVSPCGCRHSISETRRGELIAACCCEWDCGVYQIQPADILVHGINLERFGSAIKRALGFAEGGAAAYASRGLREIGSYAAAAAPVYFSMEGTSGLLRELTKLLGLRDGPFLVLTPTGSSWSAEVEALARPHAGGHVSLASVLECRVALAGGHLEECRMTTATSPLPSRTSRTGHQAERVPAAFPFTANGMLEPMLAQFARRVGSIPDSGGTLRSIVQREIAAVRKDRIEFHAGPGAVEEDAAERSSGALPRYLLRKGLQGWRLVFDGKETVLWDEKAVTYIAVLLLQPPVEPIHGTELAHRAFGDAVVEDQRNLAMDDVDTAREMAAARARCCAVIDDELATEVEKEEARGELEAIQEWAQKHMRGTEGNEQRQVRAIRQSIRRLLERLRTARGAHGEKDEVLRAFGEHLERYLWRASGAGARGRRARVRAGVAGRFTYEPPPGVKWSS